MEISADPQDIDVQQYTLDLEFFPATYSISGTVTIEAETEGVSLATLYIDCHDTLTISSLEFDESPKSYTHADDKITLAFDPPLSPYQAFEVEITYDGTFTPFQEEGLIFNVHGDDDVPVISTLSETYLAPSWWPCIDNPDDKAPIEIYITCPSEIDGQEMKAISNGSLAETIDHEDGTTTFHWSETYSIATYLVTVAISNYVEITSLPKTYDTMPLNYYCYPEHMETAEYYFAQVYDLIDLYSDRLGEYPFISEKHGIIEVPMGASGMEHQTITCINDERVGGPIGSYPVRVIIGHEVAHQWFGDSVTMKTWNDIWLNEGLATFFQFYYREAFGEIPAVIDKLKIFDIDLFGNYYADPIYVRDITDPFANSGTIYFKGAWVIHMLREMIDDDDLFFSILESYLANHAYSNTETDDFRMAFENGMGTSQDYFFDQWIYTPSWPVYSIIYENSSRDGGYKVDINVQQLQEHDVVDIDEIHLRDYYIMPVTFTVHYTDETTETFTVTNDLRNQSFQLLTTKEPDFTVFDESLDMLSEVQGEEGSDDDGVFIDGDGNGIPGDNPCTGGATEDCDDNCPNTPNPDQQDSDGDGFGDSCDFCVGNGAYDNDEDELCNGEDNCPDHPNSEALGTCVKTKADMTVSYRVGDPKEFITCTSDTDCEATGGTCQLEQGDSNGNGCGDVCECLMDCNSSGAGDGKVTGSDLGVLKGEYGRFDCNELDPCYADGNGDGKVTGADLSLLKNEYGRFDCPACQ
ncbi:MAG: hypothetical protein AMJ42_05925 [Deltaproteobacteria bacterium DG_8]|nr:MAG: hypothetical protein AMJ42_05925 [Deltaproteobacteria bacterium DG_8]